MRRRRPAVTIAIAALAVLALCQAPGSPVLLWNPSASAPIGLYAVLRHPVGRGDRVALRLPDATAALAAERGYLPRGALLLKTIAAISGDHVCRLTSLLLINGRPRAVARRVDKAGRPLPRWHGCRRLRPGELLVLGESADSFDSRYLGPLPTSHVAGGAVALWIIR
jgi:conjugative transfer signal peptidase TraF